jgi:hypothetical protein
MPPRTTNRSRPPRSATVAKNHLLDAIKGSAIERGHGPQDTARSLDIVPSHWYRLRKHPERLAKSEHALLRRIAVYIGWTHLDVCVASGTIDPADLWASPQTDSVLRQAVQQVSRSPLASGLAAPLSESSRDLQLLVARLFVATQAHALGDPQHRD